MSDIIIGREKNSKFYLSKKRKKNIFDAKIKKNIIPIASGKGGVGKTFLAVNLGIALARKKKNTVIIDLDLGSSNLHTYLGMKSADKGIGEFLTSDDKDLNAYKVPTKIPHLEIIQGDQLVPDVANLKPAQKKRLLEAIYELENDTILLDLSAGSHANVLDFFLFSNHGIMVCSPTHGSVLNAFGFLKTCVYRLFLHHFQNPKFKRIIHLARRKNGEEKYPTFWDTLNDIGHYDANLARQFKNVVEQFRPALIFNMVESLGDIELIRQLMNLIHQKILLDLDVLGYVPRHRVIHESVRNRIPLAFFEPQNRGMKNIEVMAGNLIHYACSNHPLFDLNKYETSVDQIEDWIRLEEGGEPISEPVQQMREPTQQMRKPVQQEAEKALFRQKVRQNPSLVDVIQKQYKQNMESLRSMSFGRNAKW